MPLVLPQIRHLVTSSDPVDIEHLVNRHKNAVYRQMVRVCGNHDDAEDALANALLSAYRASKQLSDPSQFQAWLARIATRACTRMRVRDKLRKSLSFTDLQSQGFQFTDSEASPGHQLEMQEMKNCVAKAVQSLPEPYQDVYVRKEFHGQSTQQILDETGLTLAAMKSRLHRAREMVRGSLDNELGCQGMIEST